MNCVYKLCPTRMQSAGWHNQFSKIALLNNLLWSKDILWAFYQLCLAFVVCIGGLGKAVEWVCMLTCMENELCCEWLHLSCYTGHGRHSRYGLHYMQLQKAVQWAVLSALLMHSFNGLVPFRLVMYWLRWWNMKTQAQHKRRMLRRHQSKCYHQLSKQCMGTISNLL